MNNNVKIIDIGKQYGNMNTNKSFYPEYFTPEMRKESFMNRRIQLGEDFGFDGHAMFMADQNNKNGSYFEITRDYVEANPNGWTDIPEDILIITDKVPRVVIGHPVADCPAVMMSDKKQGISAIGHCSAEMIDRKLPIMISEALRKGYNSKAEDLDIYVSAMAQDGYIYGNYPGWATDTELWKKGIEEVDGKFVINMRKVLIEEFKRAKLNLENVKFSNINTITDPNYYSNFASHPNNMNDKNKAGRNFAGLFYGQPEEVKIYRKNK